MISNAMNCTIIWILYSCKLWR